MEFSVRTLLDTFINETDSYDSTVIPQSLLNNIKKWKWGSYGWVSPASLIFTATWRKVYYPKEDCCKIWARDEHNRPIPNSYSIRSEDESITIPLLAKHGLCQGFCSDNSGMQGSRAIEKMRTLKRLDVDFDTSQRTVFDLKLFATILNQINSLTQEQALEVLRFLIFIAKENRKHRDNQRVALQKQTSISVDILSFLEATADPELTKCITAACYSVILGPHGCVVSGVDDHKTASDSRSKKHGDLCIICDDEPRIAIEVKDKTQNIDWNNIERAKKILDTNKYIRNFIFVLERRNATATPIIAEMFDTPKLYNEPYKKISIISIFDLYLLASSIADIKTITRIISNYIVIIPAIKPETKDSWIRITSVQDSEMKQ